MNYKKRTRRRGKKGGNDQEFVSSTTQDTRDTLQKKVTMGADDLKKKLGKDGPEKLSQLIEWTTKTIDEATAAYEKQENKPDASVPPITKALPLL